MPPKIVRRRRGSGKMRHPAPRKPLPIKKQPERDGRCVSPTRNCSKCGWRYVRGDRSPNCPQCGKEHRCGNKAVKGKPVCRLHGGGKGGVVVLPYKFRVAHQIIKAYDRLVASPDLLNLSAEIAAITARTDELFGMLDTLDTRAVSDDVTAALARFEMLLVDGLGNQGDKKTIPVHAEAMKAACTYLRRAIEPVNVERHVWGMISDNMELTRRLNDTERKWLVSNEGMVPVVFVLEVLIRIQRITLKYIQAPADRTAFANDFRNEAAIDVIAREVGSA